MTYNRAFDIPANSFDFSADLKFGEMGEEFIKHFYEAVVNGSAEVKTDRYRNGRMVIETQQNPRRMVDSNGIQIWKHSGINVTQADWWIYVYSFQQSFVIASVERIKRFLRMNNHDRFNEQTKKIFGVNGDNPAKGFLLEKHEVMEMLYDEKYD